MKLVTLFALSLSMASIGSAGRSHSFRHRQLHQKRDATLGATFTWGDPDDGTSPGVILENKSAQSESYFFFDNISNGDGTADPNFNAPSKYITMPPGLTAFVSLDSSFKGRVQRGTQLPATWVEFQLAASNDKGAHGDISLEQGYDGPATIASTEPGNTSSGGFTNEILPGAPSGAIVNKPDGTPALGSTMGNWAAGPNKDAINWENEQVGQSKAYITGGTGVPDVSSSNQRLRVAFY